MKKEKIIRIYRVNTGSCGGCDVEIAAAVERSAELAWADTPDSADLLLVTGPILGSGRAAFQSLCDALGGRVPLLAVGRCAIDGHPFGRGGLAELAGLRAHTLDGCAPTPDAIADGARRALREHAAGE